MEITQILVLEQQVSILVEEGISAHLAPPVYALLLEQQEVIGQVTLEGNSAVQISDRQGSVTVEAQGSLTHKDSIQTVDLILTKIISV